MNAALTALLWLTLLGSAAAAALWATVCLHPATRSNFRFHMRVQRDDADRPTVHAITPATFAGCDHTGRPTLNADATGDTGRASPLDDLPDALWPRVCVIVPGRNEEQWLPQSLPRLIEQDYPATRLTVVFVDDDSDDRTQEITAELRERYRHEATRFIALRNAQTPPPGWIGKCWALQQGWHHAQTLEETDGQRFDYLCFTDADVLWEPLCLRAAVREAVRDRRGEGLGERAGLVSQIAALRFAPGPAGVVQALTQMNMVMALGMLYPLSRAMDPAVPWTLAGGPFILCDRDAYAAIGGHAAVKDRIVDDIELGNAMKRPRQQGGGGVQVRLFYAPELLGTQMYNDWADMWEGFTKNSYAALSYSPWQLAAAVTATLITNVFVPVYPLLAACLAILTADFPGTDTPTRPSLETSWPVIAALACSIVALGFNLRANLYTARAFKLPPYYALLGWLGAAMFLTMVLGSAWRYHFAGGNVWKGRAYGQHGEIQSFRES